SPFGIASKWGSRTKFQCNIHHQTFIIPLMDRFLQLEAFVAAATLGSFSDAARAEGVSPALIGRRIDALEARLGVRLFIRSTRKLSLTVEGETLLEDIPGILDALQQTEARISQASMEPT